jgi:hypothetical protein
MRYGSRERPSLAGGYVAASIKSSDAADLWLAVAGGIIATVK